MASLDPDGPPPPALAAVLAEVVVRRTRAEVAADAGQVRVRLPAREPPAAVTYALDDAYPGFFEGVITSLDALGFAPYRAGGREGGGELMRLTLLKRLESSRVAFSASLVALRRFFQAFTESARCGRLLRASDNRALGGSDGLQLLLEPLVLDAPGRGLDLQALARDTERDLAALGRIAESLAAVRTLDPKLEALSRLLDGPLEGRKVLLFTEFRETARWLWRSLLPRGRVGLIDGAGAFLGAGRATRGSVVRHFAPRANGASAPPPREALDLLIATDVLSEGMNLQDAHAVISFDLPWNPVRLIQRVGRIDRLGSPHASIRCYNFLPDRGLDIALRLLARLRTKLAAIRRGLGGEDAVLGPDPTASLVERIRAGDPRLFDDLEAAESPARDALRTAYLQFRDQIAVTNGAPAVARAPGLRPGGGGSGLVVVLERGGRLEGVSVTGTRARTLDDRLLTVLLRTALETDELVAGPLDTRDVEAAVRCALEAGTGAAAGNGLPRSTVAGAAARRLLRSLALHPECAVAEVCDRVDALVRRLAAGLRAGEEVVVQEWLVDPADRPAVLCSLLEARLGSGRAERPGARALCVFV